MHAPRYLCLPGRRMRDANPFTALLVESLVERGAVVDDFTPKNGFLAKYEAVILHWPDHFSSQRGLAQAIMRTLFLICVLTIQRVRGAQIIRFVHDVNALFPQRSWLRSLNRFCVDKLVTGYVFLSETSEEAFRQQFPHLDKVSGIRLFHPRFGKEIKSPKRTSTSQIQPTVRYVGDIKPYKGLEDFLDLITRYPIQYPFEIYGQCSDTADSGQLLTKIRAAQTAGNKVSIVEGRPDHERFSHLIAEAGILVLPYREGWNSGMAMSALEAGTPILCRQLPIFMELQNDVGKDWIATFDMNGTKLNKILQSRLETPPDANAEVRLRRYLTANNWQDFTEKLLAFTVALKEKKPLKSYRYASDESHSGSNKHITN